MFRPLIIVVTMGALSIGGAVGLVIAHGASQELQQEHLAGFEPVPAIPAAVIRSEPRPVEGRTVKAQPAYAPPVGPVAPLASPEITEDEPANSILAVPTSPRPKARSEQAGRDSEEPVPLFDDTASLGLLPFRDDVIGPFQPIDLLLPVDSWSGETVAIDEPNFVMPTWSVGVFR